MARARRRRVAAKSSSAKELGASELAPRVAGLETEHAILFRPATPGATAPTRRQIYELIEERIAARLPTLPSGMGKRGRFLPNGGVVQYEALAPFDSEGLLELATPECRDPFELSLHHRALEEIAQDVLPEVEAALAEEGHPGMVALGKNCLDYKGNFYGAHENFEVEDARGLASRVFLALWVGIVWLPAAIPFAVAILAGVALLALNLLSVLVAFILIALGRLPIIGEPFAYLLKVFERAMRALGRWSTRVLEWMLEHVAPGALLAWSSYVVAALRPFCLRRFQRDLPGFMVTRILYTGAGRVNDKGDLELSQRAPIIGKVAGLFTNKGARPVFDMRDLHWPPQAALARRKRLHVLHGDANLSDVATMMKVGCTQLVLDVIEADLPIPGVRLADPIGAMQMISAARGADVDLELAGGGTTTAFAVQRSYLAVVEEHFAPALAGAPGAGAERVRDLVRRWRGMLDGLESNPHLLFRDVDWVAKLDLMLLSEQHSGLPGIESPDRLARMQKLDLRYHELSREGIFARLESAGLVTQLHSREEALAACLHPPARTRATVRGALVARYGPVRGDMAASWSRVVGRDPVKLEVHLDDANSDAMPADLPSAPAERRRTGGVHDAIAPQMALLTLGTGRSNTIISGNLGLFAVLMIAADVVVALTATSDSGNGALVAQLAGFIVLAPLVAVTSLAALRNVFKRVPFKIEEILAGTINAAILNTAALTVTHVLFGQPPLS